MLGYILLCMLFGLWNYWRGWAFLPATIAAFIFTPIIGGIIFTLIRGIKDNDRGDDYRATFGM